MKIGFFITGIAGIKKPCISRMQRVINISPCGRAAAVGIPVICLYCGLHIDKIRKNSIFYYLAQLVHSFFSFYLCFGYYIILLCDSQRFAAGKFVCRAGACPCPAMNVVILLKSRINKKTEISQTSVFLFFTMLSGKREALSRSTGVTSNASAISKNTSIENP